MADDGWLLVELLDHAVEMVGDVLDRLAREHARVRLCLRDGLGIVWPARSERRVAGLLEERLPAVPAARQQPQSVDENDRRAPRRVGVVDLLLFVLREVRHEPALLLLTAQSVEPDGHEPWIRRR